MRGFYWAPVVLLDRLEVASPYYVLYYDITIHDM